MFQSICIPRVALATLLIANISIFFMLAMLQTAHSNPLSKWTVGTMGKFTLLPEPRPVPDITFRRGSWSDTNEEKLKLTYFTGKVLLVNFWATWCGPCRKEMFDLDRLQKKLGGTRFAVLAISSDRKGLAVVKQFYLANKIKNLPLYIDKTTRAQRTLGVYGLPTTIIIDGKGRELGRLVGSAKWSSKDAITLIEKIISR